MAHLRALEPNLALSLTAQPAGHDTPNQVLSLRHITALGISEGRADEERSQSEWKSPSVEYKDKAGIKISWVPSLQSMLSSSPGAEGGQAAANSNLLWLLLQQQQSAQQAQQQQPHQRAQQPDWGQLISSLTSDPSTAQQVGPILAALAAKGGTAPASGQEADSRSAQGVAGLRAAAQASGGEIGSDGAASGGAFTEVPQRAAPSKDGEATAASAFPKDGVPDMNQLASLLQMA